MSVFDYALEILARHVISKPDAVVAAEERVAIPVHRVAVHDEHDWSAMPCADVLRGRDVRGEVHVLARSLVDACGQNGIKTALGSAVVEPIGRGASGQI